MNIAGLPSFAGVDRRQPEGNGDYPLGFLAVRVRSTLRLKGPKSVTFFEYSVVDNSTITSSSLKPEGLSGISLGNDYLKHKDYFSQPVNEIPAYAGTTDYKHDVFSVSSSRGHKVQTSTSLVSG
ncbi:hypothetical protein [Salinimonas lutimaris]|uniref:hypothetical protein n=1 Tax=Salinimonas lutimaris TaxID=914153 RepID=UPI0010C157D7|nr:hypothetical protein [Salinimonas lutimaris]